MHKSRRERCGMIDSNYYKRLSEREAAIIFNLGLRKAVRILEKA